MLYGSQFIFYAGKICHFFKDVSMYNCTERVCLAIDSDNSNGNLRNFFFWFDFFLFFSLRTKSTEN